MTADTLAIPKPGNPAIRVGKDGKPRIEGYRCGDCGTVVEAPTLACRACASRTAPEAFRAKERGSVHTWSIVHRSYPGIETPFASVIVDLDGGPTLKGTLRNANLDDLTMGMPVKLVFDDAGGAKDKDGVPYVGFHFEPEGEQA